MNTETQLYLALKNLTKVAHCHHSDMKQATDALEQFELELGPIPDWAVAHNLTDELVPGLQLFTKDGRNIGNAHITLVTVPPAGCTDVYYHLLTDAGSEVRFSLREVNDWFYPGKFISKPEDVIARFGRCDSYKED